jgi:hypothetical protein
MDRGKTISAYEGDNHFHKIKERRKSKKNFSQLMEVDNYSINRSG